MGVDTTAAVREASKRRSKSQQCHGPPEAPSESYGWGLL